MESFVVVVTALPLMTLSDTGEATVSITDNEGKGNSLPLFTSCSNRLILLADFMVTNLVDTKKKITKLNDMKLLMNVRHHEMGVRHHNTYF